MKFLNKCLLSEHFLLCWQNVWPYSYGLTGFIFSRKKVNKVSNCVEKSHKTYLKEKNWGHILDFFSIIYRIQPEQIPISSANFTSNNTIEKGFSLRKHPLRTEYSIGGQTLSSRLLCPRNWFFRQITLINAQSCYKTISFLKSGLLGGCLGKRLSVIAWALWVLAVNSNCSWKFRKLGQGFSVRIVCATPCFDDKLRTYELINLRYIVKCVWQPSRTTFCVFLISELCKHFIVISSQSLKANVDCMLCLRGEFFTTTICGWFNAKKE